MWGYEVLKVHRILRKNKERRAAYCRAALLLSVIQCVNQKNTPRACSFISAVVVKGMRVV